MCRFVGVFFSFGLLFSLFGLSQPSKAASTTISATNKGTTGSYSGSDGAVEYQWTAPSVGSANSLGSIHISGQLNGADAEIDVPIGVVPASASLNLQSAQAVATDASSVTYRLNFLANSTSVIITVKSSMSGKTLNTDIQADHPAIADIYGNVLPATSHISPVNVPYYSGQAVYLPDWGVFANGYFDWQNSSASEIDPMQAAYYPLTNGTRNIAKDRFVLSVSGKFSEVLPVIGNPVSTYRTQLAGRTVIDIWDLLNFGQLTQAITTLGNSGVKNCVVLVHNWQQNGYDNALPATYPANTSQGGNSQLAQAIAAGRNIGCYVGLHENYVDYYPNFPNFTNSAVALNGDGTEELAWLNTTTQVQSYATKQAWVMANASKESPQIHSGLNTNASFIDVNSAALPWFHTDMDASQSGAGMFSTVFNTSKALWNFERQTQGGPVFGEGRYHWYWSGLLDGVEAQLGAGVNSQAENTPLFVDFDLLKIHPLQVNHGMGMYDRWLTAGETMTQTNLMDAYRMQEVIYGHAPYIGGGFWSNIDRVLQEQNLVSPVAQRYGTQTATSIYYQVNGAWTDSSAAIKASDWSRVAVQYANGDTIVANAQAQPLTLGGVQLPQYGWAAQGNNLLAYTALRNGLLADYAQTATSFFANARNQADLAASGAVAKPTLSFFKQTGTGTASYQVQWQVLDGPQGESLSNFIHFVDNSGNIAFQGGYNFSAPSTQWKPGQNIVNTLQLSIPSTVPDGSYSVRAGLYSQQTGLRVQAFGVDDGSERYILGTITVTNHGQSLAFQPQAAPVLAADARMNASGAVVDFSTLRTDGMVSLNLNAGNWTLETYPRYRNVVVQLNASQFPAPSHITCDSVAAPSPTITNGFWQLATKGAQSCSWTKP